MREASGDSPKTDRYVGKLVSLFQLIHLLQLQARENVGSRLWRLLAECFLAVFVFTEVLWVRVKGWGLFHTRYTNSQLLQHAMNLKRFELVKQIRRMQDRTYERYWYCNKHDESMINWKKLIWTHFFHPFVSFSSRQRVQASRRFTLLRSLRRLCHDEHTENRELASSSS